MEAQETERFEGWCICEIMGHQTFAGFVSERTIAGAAMLQVDVPQVDEQHPAFTKLFSPGAVYAITPTTEEHARAAAAQIRVRPVTLYILPESRRLADNHYDPRDASTYGEPDDFEGDDDEVDDDWEDDL